MKLRDVAEITHAETIVSVCASSRLVAITTHLATATNASTSIIATFGLLFYFILCYTHPVHYEQSISKEVYTHASPQDLLCTYAASSSTYDRAGSVAHSNRVPPIN